MTPDSAAPGSLPHPASSPGAAGVAAHRAPSGIVLGCATFALFLVWSHTFLAFEVLLAPKSGTAPFDALGLTVARFAPVTVLCAAWCFGVKRREALAIVRAHPGRLLLCGALAVPVYNAALYYGMEHHVAGPVASLLTTLSPLYLLVLGVVALGERITWRKGVGLALGLTGVVLIATAKAPAGEALALPVLVLALAPLGWSVHTALSKPMTRTHPPVLWTYLALVAGGLPLLFVLPFHGGPQMAALDTTGALLLAYLVLFATIGGFAAWTWLLKYLPASTVGLTIFLNPPLTTAGKWVLARVRPEAFTFSISPLEWVGGAVSLLGVAVAVLGRKRV